MKKRIGIIGNERSTYDKKDQHTYYFSYTPRDFVQGFIRAEGLPIILPVGVVEDTVDYIQLIDVLVLAGGQDIDPKYFHQQRHPRLGEVFEARDEFELALIKEAVKQGKSIVGVCRGMQVINVAFGGTLYQDVSLTPYTLKHVQSPISLEQPTHDVTIKQRSLLSQFLPSTYKVNSYHHQFVDKVANHFEVTATASDGAIEAIESKFFGNTIVGVQWHPEQSCHTNPLDQEFFNYIVQHL
ncbi:gamma-glutamyl-gamma-aminobutyrate hydrolase family protein [Enterococcus camelliae]|uniref:Gamma-glutamyl-gamma-aminobutyrate hydrolase family protein n=1 Tax=Enterococcus camelliae TaxID=453959 RepID=A0ABW5TL26_9ENTE